MIAGGGLTAVGVVLWGEAAAIQNDIDTYPTMTTGQILALQKLEERGDSFASLGNVLFLSGAVIGGVSTYFYLRGRNPRSTPRTARIAPAVFDHGGGITLTIGGSP